MLRDAWCISLLCPEILKQYISSPNFNHEIDTIPMQQLLQCVTKQCQKQVQITNIPLNNRSSRDSRHGRSRTRSPTDYKRHQSHKQ